MKRASILLALAALPLLAGHALAMRSEHYWLDWFTPLTSGAGGPANSTNYAVHFTVGQSAIGASTSTQYGVGLGYWFGYEAGPPSLPFKVHLPLVLRNYP